MKTLPGFSNSLARPYTVWGLRKNSSRAYPRGFFLTKYLFSDAYGTATESPTSTPLVASGAEFPKLSSIECQRAQGRFPRAWRGAKHGLPSLYRPSLSTFPRRRQERESQAEAVTACGRPWATPNEMPIAAGTRGARDIARQKSAISRNSHSWQTG